MGVVGNVVGSWRVVCDVVGLLWGTWWVVWCVCRIITIVLIRHIILHTARTPPTSAPASYPLPPLHRRCAVSLSRGCYFIRVYRRRVHSRCIHRHAAAAAPTTPTHRHPHCQQHRPLRGGWVGVDGDGDGGGGDGDSRMLVIAFCRSK